MKDIKKNLIIFSILFIVITAGVLLFSFWLEKEQKKKNPFLQDLKAGDVITFGRYEQDNRLKNGPEDLKWIVLDSNFEADVIILLSEYCIDVLPLNNRDGEYYWADCSLRKWLNEDFYNATFDEEEKKWIDSVRMENYDEPYFKTPAGRNTTDKVILLGEREIVKYYPDTASALSSFWENEGEKQNDKISNQVDSNLQTTFTDYAKKKYLDSLDTSEIAHDLDTASWWIRTPGLDLKELNGLQITEKGAFGANNANVLCGVRPVICISRNAKNISENTDDSEKCVPIKKYIEGDMDEQEIDEMIKEEMSASEVIHQVVKSYISTPQQVFEIYEDGTVWSFSYSWQPDISSWKDVKKVYCEKGLVIGIDKNGKMLCYKDLCSEFGDIIFANINNCNQAVDNSGIGIKDIAINSSTKYIMILHEDSQLVFFGDDSETVTLVTDLDQVIDIIPFENGFVFLNEDGTIVSATGKDWVDQQLSSWRDVNEICAGECFVAGLKKDGTVLICGAFLPSVFSESYAEDLSDWTDIQSISAGDNHIVGLKSDGTVVAKGLNSYGQCNVSNLKNIVRIEASGNVTVVYDEIGRFIRTGEDIWEDYIENGEELSNYDICLGYD